MTRLYEFQSKKLLKNAGILIPEGEVAATPIQARSIAEKLGKPVVMKIQVWVTGRAGCGGIVFADSPGDAEAKAAQLLGKQIGNVVVDRILVEEKLDIDREFFAGFVIDDAEKSPLLVFSAQGGTGIEDIARRNPGEVARAHVNVLTGLRDYQARDLVRKTGIHGKLLVKMGDVLTRLYGVLREYDARSAEINPLVLTKEGEVYAADCHLAVDDYAVFRHPELGIAVAREFDRPPTELETIAYRVEEKDHRGTFYFLQMKEDIAESDRAIGFNGAGGGGSMMSMDALLNRGFELANYCDTSGNPSASKVYRAARIILSQPNIKGYFASGSGVASQEQYHSARGIVKAFREENLDIPAVIRLGGNFEEKAMEILDECLRDLPAPVEGYGRDDSPEFCARRLSSLIEKNSSLCHTVKPLREPIFPREGYAFETLTGKVVIDREKCLECSSKGCITACVPRILRLEEGKPALAIDREEAGRGKCTECLACELYCTFHEKDAVMIHLPIPGLKELRASLLTGVRGE